MNKKDGGPVFPGDEKCIVKSIGELTGKKIEYESWQYQSGIKLRDYFAGMAMQGLMSDYEGRKKYLLSKDVSVEREAYQIADAMIAERDRENEHR